MFEISQKLFFYLNAQKNCALQNGGMTLSRLCRTSTEHDEMYLSYFQRLRKGRAVKLESLIKTLGKIHVSEEDGLSNHY